MADDTKKKVVEFEIRGNTVNLEKEIQKAINSINNMQHKLESVAPKKQTTGLGSPTGILKNVHDLDKLKTSLGKIPVEEGVPVEQLNYLTAANKSLSKAEAKLSQVTKVTSTNMKQLNKELVDVNKGMKYMDKRTEDLTDKSEKLSARFGKMALQLFALQRIFNWVVRRMKEGIRSSMEFVETMNLFNVATKESSKSVSEFVENYSKIFSLDPNVLYKYAGTFYNIASSLGAASKEAEILGENLTSLTLDLASLFNTDVETMAVAVRSGITGISKPLKKYGIILTDAVAKQEAAALGISKSWNDMSEIDKVMLRYLALLRQTSSAQGDLARTLESPENQLRVMNAQLDILFRNLGSIFMIAGQVVLPVINGLLIGTNKLLSTFAKAAGYVIPDLSKNLTGSTEAIEGEEEAVNSLNDAVSGALAPFDELNILSKENGQNKMFSLDPKIAEALKGYDNLMDKVATKADKLGEIFERIFNPKLMEAFGTGLRLVFDVFSLGVDMAIGALDLLSYPLNWLTTAIAALLSPIQAIIDGFTSEDKTIKALSITAATFTGAILAMIAAQKAYNYVAVLGNGVFENGIRFLKEYMTLFVGQTANTIKDTAVKLKNAIAAKAQAAAEWWHNASLASKLMLVSAGTAVGVIAAAGIAAAVMSAKAKESEVNVPAMATGGVVSSPTMALVGEGRYSEAVVPLGSSPQFASMKEDIAEAVANRLGNNSNSNIQVVVKIGERDFSSYTYDIVSNENKRRAGASLERVTQKVGR